MYLPRHFAETERAVIVDLLRQAGFGHVVVAGSGTLDAVPLPFLVDDPLTSVRAHVARANPVWRQAPCPALLIVPVSDTYVSPSWYASKAEQGEVVPTWNYEVVHVYGTFVARDRDWTATLVRDLTDHHEADRANAWSVDDAPSEYVDRLLGAIVGVELQIDRVQAKRKLSQNRPEADRSGVIAGLRAAAQRGAEATAAAIDTASG
jgi:transcriptional regulator